MQLHYLHHASRADLKSRWVFKRSALFQSPTLKFKSIPVSDFANPPFNTSRHSIFNTNAVIQDQNLFSLQVFHPTSHGMFSRMPDIWHHGKKRNINYMIMILRELLNLGMSRTDLRKGFSTHTHWIHQIVTIHNTGLQSRALSHNVEGGKSLYLTTKLRSFKLGCVWKTILPNPIASTLANDRITFCP